MRDRVGIAVERAIADHGARAEIEIEHRREAEVDAMRAQFARQHLAQPLRLGGGRGDIAFPQFAQRAHRAESP